MRASEEALYASDPLGSVPPEQIRAEILATGAPPQMTKDGPKRVAAANPFAAAPP